VAGYRRASLTVLYDRDCEICVAAASWIGVLDRRGAVRCVAFQDGPVTAVHPGLSLAACATNLHVVGADGRIDAGWPAVARIAEAIPVLRPLAALDRLPPARAAAQGAYGYARANRHQLCYLPGRCMRGSGRRQALPQG
jgi:predicted DCC family thiol-disulfide oxidoreductase YuxK